MLVLVGAVLAVLAALLAVKLIVRRRRAWLGELVEAAPVAAALVGRDGRVLQSNRQAASLGITPPAPLPAVVGSSHVRVRSHPVGGGRLVIFESESEYEELRRLSQAVAHSADLVMVTDRLGVIEYVNPALEARSGYSRAELIGHTPRVFQSGVHDRGFYEQMWETLASGQVYRATFVNRSRGGELYYVAEVIAPVRDAAGSITHFVSTGRDITEHRRLESQLDRLMYYDPLTKAGNRALLETRLQAITRLQTPAALVVLNVDRFRTINEALGRPGGDEVLIQIVERLRGVMRAQDEVCRLGADEFALLLVETDEAVARQVLSRAQVELAKPFVIMARRTHLTVTAGIALHPRDSIEPQEIISCADTALRAARAARVPSRAYAAVLTRLADERVTIESSLTAALGQRRLLHHYQPVAHLRSGIVTGAEALMRWPDGPVASLGPDRFIPVAEESGQIIALDRWSISAAVQQAAEWTRRGWIGWLAVNLSGRTLGDAWLVAHLDDELGRCGLAPDRLVIEVTESALVDTSVALPVMRDLHALGVRIAVDDFGTGYSSLASLHEYTVDLVKVDKRFVHGIERHTASESLVRSVIAMAGALDARVIAEGIETEAQRDWLRSAGCDYGQGFLLGRPLTTDQFEREFAGLRAVDAA